MQASILLNTLKIFSYIPGVGPSKDFHVIFSKEGQAIVNCGILYSKIEVSLGLDRAIALSWKRLSSLLNTLGSKNIEFTFDGDVLKWKASGMGYNNKGTLSYIDPNTLLESIDVSLPETKKCIPVTEQMRSALSFYIKSIDFENYSQCRGVSIIPKNNYIIAAATNGISLGISEIHDYLDTDNDFGSGVQILVPHALSKIIANSETQLDSKLFYELDESGTSVTKCGYIFDNGFVVSAVEKFNGLDFEKHKSTYVPNTEISYIPFSVGLTETLNRISIFDDGWDISITNFRQKNEKLIISTESSFGTIEDTFDIPFQEEAFLRCATSLLKKAGSAMDGVYPIHATHGAFVFVNETKTIFFIVSPVSE